MNYAVRTNQEKQRYIPKPKNQKYEKQKFKNWEQLCVNSSEGIDKTYKFVIIFITI